MKANLLNTWRALGALTLGLVAQSAMADEYLYGYSSGNSVNNLTVNGSSVLYSGSNQGWWSPQQYNSDWNDNYIVGTQYGTQWNNFFTFDISNVTGPVTSAVLNLQFNYAFSSTNASALLYTLFDVSTDAGTLNSNNGTSQAIYDDLGSGTSYGAFWIATNQGSGDVVSLSLNAAGVAALNAAVEGEARTFSIGGTLAPSTNSVPDGANSLALFGIAAAALCVVRRKLA